MSAEMQASWQSGVEAHGKVLLIALTSCSLPCSAGIPCVVAGRWWPTLNHLLTSPWMSLVVQSVSVFETETAFSGVPALPFGST